MDDAVLRKQIFDDKPEVAIRDKSTNSLLTGIQSLSYDSNSYSINGVIQNGTVNTNISKEYNFLPVPGVGYITPGAGVTYKNDKYILEFGWHLNTSNQRIYSWYLRPVGVEYEFDHSLQYMSNPMTPLDSSVCKTLYYEMIDEIELIEI